MKRYMINTNTGVIMAYRADVMAMNNSHLKECTADGVIFGAANTEVDALKQQLGELQMLLDEKNRRMSNLESYIAQLEMKKNSSGENPRRRELEELKLEELKTIAAKMGLNTDGRKSDIIESIIAAEKTTE